MANGQLGRCSETDVGVPTYWIVDRGGACDGLAGQTPELVRDSADPTQFRLCVRISSHSEFWRGEERRLCLTTLV